MERVWSAEVDPGVEYAALQRAAGRQPEEELPAGKNDGVAVQEKAEHNQECSTGGRAGVWQAVAGGKVMAGTGNRWGRVMRGQRHAQECSCNGSGGGHRQA